MAAIGSKTESWAGHTHAEVEAYLKAYLSRIDTLVDGNNTSY